MQSCYTIFLSKFGLVNSRVCQINLSRNRGSLLSRLLWILVTCESFECCSNGGYPIIEALTLSHNRKIHNPNGQLPTCIARDFHPRWHDVANFVEFVI